MSDNRNIISNENWVYLYSEISNWILENKSLDPIWTTDKDGNEVRTKEKQDEYLDIADEVEAIMGTVNTHGLAWQLIELTRPEEASND